MKIFIGCSSSNEISDEYKIVTKYLAEQLSKDNDLVFGCTNRGLMGICYGEFIKNNRKIIGICYEMYKDDLKDLTLSEVIMVKTLEDSSKTLEEEADILILLPGAFGTLSEFINMLEHKRTNLHNKEMIVFNINGFYDDLINMFNKINQKVSNKYDFNKLCKVFDTVDEITNFIQSKKSSK
ncbi:MAG: LOG family protein [Bacilli bacterium]|nr:LOG family protein [Bacilli bacterium]